MIGTEDAKLITGDDEDADAAVDSVPEREQPETGPHKLAQQALELAQMQIGQVQALLQLTSRMAASTVILGQAVHLLASRAAEARRRREGEEDMAALLLQEQADAVRTEIERWQAILRGERR
jgi:hypothetical protein